MPLRRLVSGSSAQPSKTSRRWQIAAQESAGGSLEKAKAALGGEDPQSMADKAMKYIKDNKLDDAQTIVDKLDSVRGSLPADWVPKVDQLKSALTTAKNAAGALPGGLPSLPK